MTAIDQNRLRRFHADKEAAHAALMNQWQRIRELRGDLAVASIDLERAVQPAPGVSAADVEAARAKHGKIIAEIEASIAAAEARKVELDDAFELNGRLWTRVRDYAQANGVLPHDLQD